MSNEQALKYPYQPHLETNRGRQGVMKEKENAEK